jgi:stage II sporulation protein M
MMVSIRALWNDLIELRRDLVTSVILLAVGIYVGLTSSRLDAFLLAQIEPLRETVSRLEMMDNQQLWIFLFIFFNNFIKALAVIFLGALLGIFPIIFLVINGLMIGFVISWAERAGASMVEVIVLGLLPHGIVELSAILIAAAFGIRYGKLVFGAIWQRIRNATAEENDTAAVKLKSFHGKLGRLIGFLFLALLLAAFIESTITFSLLRG